MTSQAKTPQQQHQQQQQSQHSQIGTKSYKIITQYGDMLVVKQGLHIHHHHHHHHQHQSYQHHHQSPTKNNQQQHQQQQQQQTRPIIMTFHDLGLNSELQFAKFCECDEVKLMLQTFTMIHVNFIGQEMLAGKQQQQQQQQGDTLRLPPDFKYPSVEQMAECIVDVCTQLKVRSFIALAVGAGAHIVCTLALMRPDLVDGLFLINPVASSCSITEWLYFKMSAIASNHQISGERSSSDSPTAGKRGSGNSARRDHSPSPSSSDIAPGGSTHSSGFRKLLNAAHIHLPTQHSTNNTNHHHSNHSSPVASERSAIGEPDSLSNAQADSQSLSQVSLAGSIGSAQSLASGLGAGHHQQQQQQVRQPASSRLRRLIVSRNFKLGHHHHNHQQAPSAPDHSESGPSSSATLERKGSRGSANSNESQTGGSKSSCRPPLEYLMYHHFGPTSFQRYRRSSASGQNAQGAGTPTKSETGEDGSSTPKGRKSGDELAGLASCSRSHDSLAATEIASTGSGSARTTRSSSLSLDAVHLAALPSGRQRVAYVRAAYKHYFGQLDEHNLWLFAQSFVKRRALNLRKDCGAAAHAAAAAAALGTSICSAFVGLAPTPAPGNSVASPAGATGAEQTMLYGAATKRNSGELTSTQQQQQQQQSESSKKQQQHALVAGTKVKRTFTCQTLIMCSSVQIHCERAFKLMSLLNPLQATWIKTDHLLVLEEKPEKVCQALRLFLQGIGYSMSTYERRLRLSHSAHGSASSADSNDSLRSSNNNNGETSIG